MRRPFTLALRRAGSIATIALGLGGAGHASAQDSQQLKRARAQFQQATELEQAGNWSAALLQFREVGQIRMTPQVRFHIAVCEESLGRLVAGLGGYELALADADKVGNDFRAEVEEKVRTLRPRIPRLVISRGAGAEAATISLDGVALGQSSIGVEVPVDPGPHAVTAAAPNRKAFEASVSLSDHELSTLEVALDELPAPNTEGPPVIIESKPRSKVLPLVLGSVGATSIVTAGVLLALRQSAASDLRSDCDGDVCPASERSRYEDLKRYHYGALVSVSVGVAALGTAGILLWRSRAPEARPRAARTHGLELVPVAPRANIGMSLTSSF